jgi:hypothetical protein
MSHPSIKSVLSYWDAHGVRYLPGVSEQEVLDFESRYNVKVPQDMRCFYQTTNGTHVPLSGGQDHESYDFYPLANVIPEDSKYPWAMTFADYRELSWWYAVDLTGLGGIGPGTVYFMGAVGGLPLIIAHSFAEFLQLYVKEDPRLWPDEAAAYHKSVTARSGPP